MNQNSTFKKESGKEYVARKMNEQKIEQLFFVEHMSISDIATQLNIPYSVVLNAVNKPYKVIGAV